MYKKAEIEKLVAEVLDGTELTLKVDELHLHENLEINTARVRCDVHHARTGEKKTIEGEGVGIVDAFFQGLVNMYSGEFHSLHTIRFTDFSIKANLETGHDARSDSTAVVTLRVTNSDEKEFVFTDTSPSISRSSVNAVLRAAEFFINSERAFIHVFKALQHAREQNRQDSVVRYTAMLTTLVEATSYTDVIDRIRKQELGR